MVLVFKSCPKFHILLAFFTFLLIFPILNCDTTINANGSVQESNSSISWFPQSEQNNETLPFQNADEVEDNIEAESFSLVRRGAAPPFIDLHSPLSSQSGQLRREYKLEDFLWTGSGDGPMPSEVDDQGGLTWVDNGGDPDHHHEVIRVTKTMILYHTIRTTIINPIELTPTVISYTVAPTPTLTPTNSLQSSPGLIEESSKLPVEPTRSLQSSPIVSSTVQPLPTPQPNNEQKTSTTTRENNEIEDMASSSTTTNRRYWVQTVIRASDGSEVRRRQRALQQNLARVYASAFKRELLSSLGVLENEEKSASLRSIPEEEPIPIKRKRRDIETLQGDQLVGRNSESEDIGFSREEIDLAWLLLGHHGGQSNSSAHLKSRIRALATAVLNVSVSIFNISSDPNPSKNHHIVMNYVVCAEGTPIPASLAVDDLKHVSKQEMENQIGYEVINKAEALVAEPIGRPGQVSESYAGISPWLIVAITTMSMLVVSIVVIVYMVWKWKHNRLGDTIVQRSRHQSGTAGNHGLDNPAFQRGSSHHIEHRDRSSRTSSQISHEKRVQRRSKQLLPDVMERDLTSKSRHIKVEEKQQKLASDLSQLLSSQQEKSPQSSIESKSKSSKSSSSEGDSGSLIHHRSSNGNRGDRVRSARRVRGGGKKDPEKKTYQSTPSPKRKMQKRKNEIVSTSSRSPKNDDYEFDENSTKFSHKKREHQRKLEFPGRLVTPNIEETLKEVQIGRTPSLDQISYEHLDICQDVVARTPSEEARKIMGSSRPGSGQIGSAGRSRTREQKLETTIDEISDLTEASCKSIEEQDRDLSEQSGDNIKYNLDTQKMTKEAGVQTPTKTRGRPKPKPRRVYGGKSSPVKKKSSESLLSTESEEIIQVHHLHPDSSSGESNPLGRMRKRFHQFLDDAFNVMGKRELDVEDGRAKSAKVSISHEIQRRGEPSASTSAVPRPWTSSVLREESVQKLNRPKSASIGAVRRGGPRRAWTAGSERRCQSAKFSDSRGPSVSGGGRRSSGGGEGVILERGEDDNSEPDEESSTIFSTEREISRIGQAPNQNVVTPGSVIFTCPVSGGPVFPNYRLYPDMPIVQSPADSSPRGESSSSAATPLIQAIKDEIKRFENVKKSTDPETIKKSLQNLPGSDL